MSGGVVFSKLSKLLNQEGALSTPLLYGIISALRKRALTGRGILRTGVICHMVCYTRVITPASADVLPMVGGRCTGRTHRCKAKQGRRGKTALKFGC
jgi:hypothetical protein